MIELQKSLHCIWQKGIQDGLVTNEEAKKTIGLSVTEIGKVRLSPNDKFKPGVPYAYPLFKVHKLNEKQLRSKVIPPLRLVTDLHDGVTARSDKFIVWRFLADLCKDYSRDLVKDSTDALIKLECLRENAEVKSGTRIFNMDVVSLYDSLRIELVLEAIDHAMNECRPEWNSQLKEWLKDLIELSCRSGVVKSKDGWYTSAKGIPTGGVPCVHIANITVYYVLSRLAFNANVRPPELISLLRFVDDGLGFWKGSQESFNVWMENLNEVSTEEFGLSFTYELFEEDQFAQFLDINLRLEFAENCIMVTDIYRKPTDANRYLQFTSHHPRHVFSSIVYSAGLRYRRLINCDITLHKRLDELALIFQNSGYPNKMVRDILGRIKIMPRILQYKERDKTKQFITPWLVMYGPGYEETVMKSKEMNSVLLKSNVWEKKVDAGLKDIVKVVTKRGPNLADMLFKRKRLALESFSEGGNITSPCTSQGCMCCKMVSKKVEVTTNGKRAKSAGGSCASRNVIYYMQCKQCQDGYVGKTVEHLKNRMNSHRKSFYANLRQAENISAVEIDDTNILGLHLITKHQKCSRSDFNKSYEVTILSDSVTPSSLRIVEQSFIDRLNTLAPFGLNQINSIQGF